MSAYGVEEMKSQELQNVDGGWIQFVVAAIVGGLIYDGACWLMSDDGGGGWQTMQSEHMAMGPRM